MELARKYYQEYGKPMLQEKFPEYVSRIAVGLVGQGSECFGFDDEISTDHDFGPSFCMWLTDEDYEKIGTRLQQEYYELPKEYDGVKSREVSNHGKGRVGVLKTSAFYRMFTGSATGSCTLREWLYVPEHHLASVTNGEIFCDELGEFTAVREYLCAYYPEEVRRKKIAARAAAMAQSGQYNYARMMLRKEVVSARMALAEFIEKTISMVNLLNYTYMPFYKWAFTSTKKLERLKKLAPLLEELSCGSLNVTAWIYKEPLEGVCRLNEQDRFVVLVEEICSEVASELRSQGLCSSKGDFLDIQAHEIMSGIQDEFLAKCHILEG